MRLATLTTKNATYLGFANAKPLGECALGQSLNGPNLRNLSIGQNCVQGFFASDVRAFTGAVSIAAVIAATAGHKALAAGSALFRFVVHPSAVFRSGGVDRCVGWPCSQLKILQAVVCLVFILVVNQLGFEQRTPKVLAHYKSMLGDISIFQGVWMFRHQNHFVPVGRAYHAPLPPLVAAAFLGVSREIADIHPLRESPSRTGTRDKRAAASAPTLDSVIHRSIVFTVLEKGNIQ